MKTYTIEIETFNTPVKTAANGGWIFENHHIERRAIVGYRAAVAAAKSEAAKGKAGHVVMLRNASGKGKLY